MKKFAKMSLIAAVAVAGLTSTSSAASLEEAIKDTKISGYLRYRFNTDHENKLDTTNEAKIVFKTTTKVNDNVTASVKFAKDITGGINGNTDKDMPVTQMYFTYANGPLTAMVGRAPAVSPLTDNSNQGDGVVATYGLGPVTLAGAYYNELHGTRARWSSAVDDLSAFGLGIIGSVEMVNFAAWYVQTSDEIDNRGLGGDVSAYALSADAKFGPVGAYIFYSDMEDDITAAGDEISFLKTGLSASFGIVSANLDYVKTGEDSGNTTFDNDTDAEANLGLLHTDLMLYADVDAWHVGVSAKVSDEVTLAAHYLTAEDDANNEVDETELNAKYQMSKNFYVLGRYVFGEDDWNGGDFQDSRIELKYSF